MNPVLVLIIAVIMHRDLQPCEGLSGKSQFGQYRVLFCRAKLEFYW